MTVTVLPPEDPADVRERAGYDRRGTFIPKNPQRLNAEPFSDEDTIAGPLWPRVFDSPPRRRRVERL